MADSSQYLVHPRTGEVGVVPAEQVSLAVERGFSPASEQQIKEYDARKEAEASPVISTLKTTALQAAQLAAPTTFSQVALGLTAEGFRRAEAPGAADVFQRAAEYVEPFTPIGAVTRLGIQTPEEIRAQAEVGGIPAQLSSMVLAAGLPAILRKAAISGAAKGATALALEEQAAAAQARAAQLASEGAPEAAVALKEAQGITAKVESASEAAAARRATLAKIPGGEKVARGVDRLLKLPDETSALNLVSESVGRPIATATEQTVRGLIESSPSISKAPQMLKDIVAKSIATGAGSAADMALLNLGQLSGEAALGDHKITAERAIAALEDGALTGAMWGASLGAIPPVMSGAVQASGAAVRGLNSFFRKWYPKAAGMFTGAAPESIEALAEAGGDLSKAGRLIEQKMAAKEPLPPEPVPFVPGVRPVPFEKPLPPLVGVEGVGLVSPTKVGLGEMAPLEPMARPEAPIPSEPLKFKPVELTPVETEQAASDLLDNLRDSRKAGHELMTEFNKFIRPAEQDKLFENYIENRLKARVQQFRIENNRFPNFGEGAKIMRSVKAAPSEEARRLAGYTRGVVNGILRQFPDAVPTQTLEGLVGYADKLDDLAKMDESPLKVRRGLDSIKRQVFEELPSKVFKDEPNVTQIERKARQAVRSVGNEIRQSARNADLWGDDAVRTAIADDARVDHTVAEKNLMRLFGRQEDIGVNLLQRQVAAKKVSSFVKKMDSLEYQDHLEALQEHQESLKKLHDVATEAARNYAGETSLDELGGAIGRVAKSMTAAENTALRRIDLEFAKQQNAKAKAEYAAFNEEIAADNKSRVNEYKRIVAEIDAAEAARSEARKNLESKVEALEGERKLKAQQDLELWKAENEKAKTLNKQRIKEFEERQKADEARVNEQRKAWQKTLDDRQAAVNEQVKALQGGAKLNSLSGAVIAYEAFTHPVLAAAATAAKNPVATYKVLNALERSARATEIKAKAFVDYLGNGDRKALRVLEAGLVPRTMKEEREQYEDRVKRIKKLATSAEDMEAHLNNSVAGVESAAPNIASHSRNVAATAVMALAGAIPKPPPNLAPFQAASWKPTDSQIREWNITYDAIAKPTTVMRGMANGTATQREIDIVNAVYGSLMSDIRNRVVQQIKDNPNVPAARRMMLSKALGIDVDGAPSLGATAQSIYATPPAGQPQDQMKIGQAKGFNLAGREPAEYEKLARRNANPTGIVARAEGRGS